MELTQITPQALSIIALLVPGYIGFRLYFIDKPWNSLNPIHVVYGSLIITIVSFALTKVAYNLAGEPVPNSLIPLVASTTFSAIIVALLWRKFGHPWTHWLLARLGVTLEDNLGPPWQVLTSNPKAHISQIIVYLQDGTALQNHDIAKYHLPTFAKNNIYPYYTGPEGDLYLVVTKKKRPNEDWEEVKEVYRDDRWGMRVTFIPHREIIKVEIRLYPGS